METPRARVGSKPAITITYDTRVLRRYIKAASLATSILGREAADNQDQRQYHRFAEIDRLLRETEQALDTK